jgi:hypothetical protein
MLVIVVRSHGGSHHLLEFGGHGANAGKCRVPFGAEDSTGSRRVHL